MFRHSQKTSSGTRGFTLIELLISIAIFGIMTALLVVKYGTFNDSVLFTNLAYDVAVTIRTAQTYGLSVRNGEGSCNDPDTRFQCAYGVHFDVGSKPNSFTIYSVVPEEDNELSMDYIAGNPHTDVSTYTLKRGVVIQGVCAADIEANCTPVDTSLDIVFKRPDPSAILCFSAIACSTLTHSEIVLQSPSGETRTVVVKSNGQISVRDN